jgi:pimeloyl-ACP methyl ester carboxylesterase
MRALLVSLFIKLGIKRVIMCGISYGTSICNKMAQYCKEFVEGTVNIAGATVIWSIGITMMYKICVVEFGYYE